MLQPTASASAAISGFAVNIRPRGLPRQCGGFPNLRPVARHPRLASQQRGHTQRGTRHAGSGRREDWHHVVEPAPEGRTHELRKSTAGHDDTHHLGLPRVSRDVRGDGPDDDHPTIAHAQEDEAGDHGDPEAPAEAEGDAAQNKRRHGHAHNHLEAVPCRKPAPQRRGRQAPEGVRRLQEAGDEACRVAVRGPAQVGAHDAAVAEERAHGVKVHHVAHAAHDQHPPRQRLILPTSDGPCNRDLLETRV
mmetsp:Transcript_100859/g.323703  ORF Transcript_100859/g.323703 Transcript_100859/m.323703 type:complete len:248 (+) Transcript_100859:783-1526(+)